MNLEFTIGDLVTTCLDYEGTGKTVGRVVAVSENSILVHPLHMITTTWDFGLFKKDAAHVVMTFAGPRRAP